MCCRLEIESLPEEWETVLKIAGFENIAGDNWIRKLGEVRCLRFSTLAVNRGWLRLDPSIEDHQMGDHAFNAFLAAVSFKVAMTLAEMSGCKVWQTGIIGICKGELEKLGVSEYKILIGDYPGQPISVDTICYGFSEIMTVGIPAPDEEYCNSRMVNVW